VEKGSEKGSVRWIQKKGQSAGFMERRFLIEDGFEKETGGEGIRNDPQMSAEGSRHKIMSQADPLPPSIRSRRKSPLHELKTCIPCWRNCCKTGRCPQNGQSTQTRSRNFSRRHRPHGVAGEVEMDFIKLLDYGTDPFGLTPSAGLTPSVANLTIPEAV
jgi:hypothetical protein